jgi:5-methylcytosine-specific restriction enzyme subunit McrC
VDIAENRLLLGAARSLLKLPRVPRSARKGLLRLASKMSDVTPPLARNPLPAWHPTRLNARYHTAVRLAELVLRATSVEQIEGRVRVNGFLFDMARIFEDFVTVALSEALTAHGGWARRQDPHFLDLARRVRMRPDLVWYEGGGSRAAVVDAKYKAEKPSGFPDADLYQMLAYCTALRLERGHLVYARGNEMAARHAIRHAGIEIVQHAVDLQQPPSELLQQMDEIARAVVSESALHV